eukprot:7672576-Alexandrium_andersonii.AAC.1
MVSDKLTVSVWDPVRLLGKDKPPKVVRLTGKSPGAKPADTDAHYLASHHWSNDRGGTRAGTMVAEGGDDGLHLSGDEGGHHGSRGWVPW